MGLKNMDMKQILNHLVTGQPMSRQVTIEAFELIMTGQAAPAQIGALLAMVQLRGPAVDELAGAATVMRTKAHRVTVPQGLRVIDTCGTGGDHAVTFNISTAAALVAAAAGRPHGVAVAKHGNRSVTSNSGSSQVLAELGVKLDASAAALSNCLDQAGICFCFAPAHHPAMKHAVPIRQELGIRTMFNLLGPLTNPAGASRQLIGVFDPIWTQPLAQVLQELGSEHAMVVCGEFPTAANPAGRLDEISTAGLTQISHLKNGSITTTTLDPATLGLAPATADQLQVDGPVASAKVIRAILDGVQGPARDIVCINAAAALVVADIAANLTQGLSMATAAIDDGSAKASLASLVRESNAGA